MSVAEKTIEEWIQFLSTDPSAYITAITLEYNKNPQNVKKILNASDYFSWYGNHAHILVNMIRIETAKYGFVTSKCFDESIILKILKLQKECGVDLSKKDYYDDTPYTLLLNMVKNNVPLKFDASKVLYDLEV